MYVSIHICTLEPWLEPSATSGASSLGVPCARGGVGGRMWSISSWRSHA